jgi:hypothetical protein
LALLKLAAIAGRNDFQQAAEKTLRLFASRLNDLPQAVPMLLQGLDFVLTEPRRAVVVGDPKDARTVALLRAVHSVYQPNKIVLGNTGAVEAFARTLPASPAPVVFVCAGHACLPPTADPKKIKEHLLA